MRKRILFSVVFFMAAVIISFLVMVNYIIKDYNERYDNTEISRQTEIIAEINGLIESIAENPGEQDELQRLQSRLGELNLNHERIKPPLFAIMLYTAFLPSVCLVLILTLWIIHNLYIIRPIGEFQYFSDEVSAGNYDVILNIKDSEFVPVADAFRKIYKELNSLNVNKNDKVKESESLLVMFRDIGRSLYYIKSYTHGLQNGMSIAPDRKDFYIATILKEAEEIEKITTDILLNSFLTGNGLKLRLNKYAAKDIVKDIFETQTVKLGGKIAIVSGIPDINIKADDKGLTQVVDYVLENCHLYADSSFIHISFSADSKFFNIAVRDFGKGISSDDLPHIFQKSYRGGNSNGIKGKGMGLYIAKAIMDKMNGSIEITGSDEGTTVFIRIPIEI